MTQLSLLDQLYSSGVVPKQRVVDWMNGSALNQRWNKTDGSGVGTATPQDAIDGGILFQSAGVTGNRSYWNFNNKRQYSNTSSSVLFIAKINSGDYEGEVGLSGVLDTQATNHDYALGGIEGSTSTTNYMLDSADATTETATAGTLAADANFHLFQLIFGASNVKLYIDNSLIVTKTTNLPTIGLQPEIMARFRNIQANVTMRYLEAYNI